MLDQDNIIVFGGTNHKQHDFDSEVLHIVNHKLKLQLQFDYSRHKDHSDGKPRDHLKHYRDIAGKTVIYFACLTTDRQELKMRDLIWSCRHQFGAKFLILVLDFLRYRRQDHEEKEHKIFWLKMFIEWLTWLGTDHLIVCEPHSVENIMKFCQAAGLPLTIVDPTVQIAQALLPLVTKLQREQTRIYSPNLGSIDRVKSLARALGTQALLISKKRMPDRSVKMLTAEELPPEIKNSLGTEIILMGPDLKEVLDKHIILRDDEINSGSTVAATIKDLRIHGALSIHGVFTHPVCSPAWTDILFPEEDRKMKPLFDTVWFGNSQPRSKHLDYEDSTGGNVNKIAVQPAIAESLVKVLQSLEGNFAEKQLKRNVSSPFLFPC